MSVQNGRLQFAESKFREKIGKIRPTLLKKRVRNRDRGKGERNRERKRKGKREKGKEGGR